MAWADFFDDDAGYRMWLPFHQDWYVLNCTSLTSLVDARLHRASCRHLLGQLDRGVGLTTSYRKYCSDTLAELETLVDSTVGHCPDCLAS